MVLLLHCGFRLGSHIECITITVIDCDAVLRGRGEDMTKNSHILSSTLAVESSACHIRRNLTLRGGIMRVARSETLDQIQVLAHTQGRDIRSSIGRYVLMLSGLG